MKLLAAIGGGATASALSPLQVVLATVVVLATLAGLIAFGRGCAWIVHTLRSARPSPGRLTPVGPRLATLARQILGHETFKHRPVVRLAHWFVMVSFVLLVGTLASAYIQVFDPTFGVPEAATSPFAPVSIINLILEFASWAGLAGIGTLIAVRLTTPGGRFTGSARAQAYFVEAVIAIVLVCVLAIHGAQSHLAHLAGVAGVWPFPLTAWLGALCFGSATPATTLVWVEVFAAVKIVTSMVWMFVVGTQVTMGVAWHRFMAVLNLYAGRNPDGRKALGALEPLLVGGQPFTDPEADIDPDEALVTTADQLPWKRVADLLSCTECGRCQELCPAWAANQPLSPKLLVAALRDHYVAQANFVTALGPDADLDAALAATHGRWARDLLPHSGDTLTALVEAGMTGPDGVPITPAQLAGEVISADTLWACTTCGACVDACPVNIELVDHVIDLRRQQTLLESAFPRDLVKPMRNLERKGNPYGLGARKRMEWARDLDFEVPVLGPEDDATAFEYLFWVGCAGAFDDKAKATSAAVARLLNAAGVSFAVLGEGEGCTGDPARRAGNELLFMTLAQANIEALNTVGARRIVVSCAHCFNTLANEYPQFGGTYEVVHYTELVADLISAGRLHFDVERGEKTVITYHDACYLGRHNNRYDAPRRALTVLGETVEMPRNRDRALCCGAGGAHAFIDAQPGERIADLRLAEATATGADIVATACPFCTTMLAAGAPTDQGPIIRDIATLLAGRLPGAEAGAR